MLVKKKKKWGWIFQVAPPPLLFLNYALSVYFFRSSPCICVCILSYFSLLFFFFLYFSLDFFFFFAFFFFHLPLSHNFSFSFFFSLNKFLRNWPNPLIEFFILTCYIFLYLLSLAISISAQTCYRFFYSPLPILFSFSPTCYRTAPNTTIYPQNYLYQQQQRR